MEKIQQPRDKWFIDGDLKLHYLDWGNPTTTPMVLLHHHCGDAHYWDFFARNMRQNYHIIAVDNRGHGDSSWVGNYGPKQYVADLAKLIAKLRLRDIVLIGHSLGGINAIIYAASHPDRVARLVIVDIGPEINIEGLKRLYRRMSSLPGAFNSEEEVVRLMKKVEPYYSKEFIRHLARYTMKRTEAGRLIFKYDPALLRADLGPLRTLWQDLGKIACPTLVVRGDESDLLLPEVARRMVETLPLGMTIEIERAGHNLPGDNPEAFETAVRNFLRGPLRSGSVRREER